MQSKVLKKGGQIHNFRRNRSIAENEITHNS